ncbi:Coccolith scale associated protein-2 [Echinococcus multilocularis]|uniref:Coccolith scale associated protein-2 n=1 Tax=Echinococcus multilocularis TaxID=6211 RepID=A0A0S4MIK3_ECHMU|nr:Coccolith scale associated protein-2 [Echinococcus multilocularis]
MFLITASRKTRNTVKFGRMAKISGACLKERKMNPPLERKFPHLYLPHKSLTAEFANLEATRQSIFSNAAVF